MYIDDHSCMAIPEFEPVRLVRLIPDASTASKPRANAHGGDREPAKRVAGNSRDLIDGLIPIDEVRVSADRLEFLPHQSRDRRSIRGGPEALLKHLMELRGPFRGGTVFMVGGAVSEEFVDRLVGRRDEMSLGGAVPFFVIPWREADERPSQSSAIGLREARRAETHLKGLRGPVLLEGETGTGKTRLARRLHNTLFGRAGGEFLHLNCGSMDRSSGSMAVQFRGVVSGYYTNVGERPSIFKDMDHGTLFLDEFQELESYEQATLLDLLDHRGTIVSGHRVGDNRVWEADVQVVVAINQPLTKLLSEGKLRPDIRFRLSRHVRLEPLRETLGSQPDRDSARLLRAKILRMQEVSLDLHRSSDSENPVDQLMLQLSFIPLDEGGFVATIRNDENAPIPSNLLTYAWPGNYRELESLAHRLMRTGRIAMWGEDEIVSAFEHLALPQTIRNEQQPIEGATRLLARAWLSAVTASGATFSSIGTSLDLNRRTVEKWLREPSARLPFLERLSDVERASFDEAREHLVGATKKAARTSA